MTRQQLEHIIRAAAGTLNVHDIVVIGSQSLLGSYPDAPQEFRDSMEADVFPKDNPANSIVIDGSIGEESMFHRTFGYYAHGVDDTTAILPNGWRDRLVRVSPPATMGAVGWCLEANDLAVSKLAAGREKDLAFVAAMLRHQLASRELIQTRLGDTPLTPEMLSLATARLARL